MVKVNWSDAHVINVLDRLIDREITVAEATAEINDQQGTSIGIKRVRFHVYGRRRIRQSQRVLRESRAQRQAVVQNPVRPVARFVPPQQALRPVQEIAHPPTAQMDSQQINAEIQALIGHWRQSVAHLQGHINNANELIDDIERWYQAELQNQGQRAIE
ncbi:hypothetical protein L596_005305 [Steinernema carpocapsae]|uniref:Uncharacterized protein n=1 Tax=Steinernema carpocapsae TaxID=34508 RepID=A0A4U8V054_STECR|nr:hypothetical protein L596_005305 [Steinernema carpocapsae]